MRNSILLLFILFVGCSSKLIVQSEPDGANVFVRAHGTEERIKIGQTPLEISSYQFQEVTKADPSAGTYFELFVEKDGFQTERLLIPATRFNTMETHVNAKLKTGEETTRTAREIVHHLVKAQRFARLKEFERAHIEIDKILDFDKEFVGAISMRASVLFLQHRYTQSLKWYEKALQLEPTNSEAVKMIAHLKKILTGKEKR